MLAILTMPTIEEAEQRLLNDDPCWKHIYERHEAPTDGQQTPWHEIEMRCLPERGRGLRSWLKSLGGAYTRSAFGR